MPLLSDKMTSPGTIISSHCLIFRGQKILLIRKNFSADYFAGKWNLPGGKIKPSEEVVAGTTREIWEETKLKVKIFSCQQIDQKIIDFGKHQGKTLIRYLCQAKSTQGQPKLSKEHLKYRWLRPQEALKLNLEPDIQKDLKSMFC